MAEGKSSEYAITILESTETDAVSEDVPSPTSPLIYTKHEGHRARSDTDTGVILRRRKAYKSSKPKRVTLLLEDEDFSLDSDIRKRLPSVRIRRMQTSLSMRDKKRVLRRSQRKGTYYVRKPSPFWERYEDLKNRNRVSFINVTGILKTSTLQRVQQEAVRCHKIKRRIQDFLDSITLWEKTFKQIEGKFGTAIMTYFRFVKWLMFLNFFIMMIILCLVTIPFLALNSSILEEFMKNGSYPVEEGHIGRNLTDSVSLRPLTESLNCSKEYLVHIYTTHEANPGHGSSELLLDFLQGTGWMERKVLFYGVYQNRTYGDDEHKVVYNVGVAYLMSVCLSMALSFVLIIKNSVKNFKASHGVEKSVAKFTNKVFGGWDFCIKDKKSAKSRKNILYIDLAADLEEIRRIERLKNRPWREKSEVYLMRIVINILVVILLIGSLSLIGFATERMIYFVDQPVSGSEQFFYQYLPFITMSLLNLVVPKVFQRLAEFEEYTHEFEITITLVRSILLRLASPIALIAILYVQLVEGINADNRTRCGNKRWDDESKAGVVKCWETYVGQQIYKLIIVDTFAVFCIVIFWHFPRSYINRKYRDKSAVVKALGPQEFNLPKSVVDIVYAQHLCWFGMFFCPLIPIITFAHCLFVFYIKKLTLFLNCRPQSEPYKASRSNSLFMKVLLVSFIFAVIPVGYVIGNIQPSQSCGPFRVYSGEDYRIYTALMDYVHSWDHVPRSVFFFVGTGLFIVPLFIILGLTMYFFWILGNGFKTQEEVIMNEYKMEKLDTKYLMKLVKEEKEKLKESQC